MPGGVLLKYHKNGRAILKTGIVFAMLLMLILLKFYLLQLKF